jgi:glycosyltransferase involved in cell wall biosynthesis
MKILVAAHAGRTNGIETYTRHLVQGLRERGHQVVIAYRTPLSDQPAGAVGTVQLDEPNRQVRRLLGPLESMTVHRRLRQAARTLDCAVVHATYPEFAFAGHPPVVVSAWHPLPSWLRRPATAWRRQERFRSEALYALSDTVAYRCAAVIALSRAVQRALDGRGRRTEWVPPFVPDRLIRPPNPRRSRSCVLIARWLDLPRKGLGLAVAATGLLAAELPGLRLVLVGGWRDPPKAHQLPPHCTAVGLRQPTEVAELLAGAGCCVIASSWEEFGYSGLEALASGTPVACTPLPGFEGLASEGLVVARRRDPASLAAAIRQALEVESFDFPPSCRSSVAIPRIERLYLDLAGGRA